MCLAVPGKVISISEAGSLSRTGLVEFSGISTQVSLAYVPEAKVDDYVIIHAGFALSVLDQEEAEQSLLVFAQMDALSD
ncbi:HypC/HybG/HupF family hydrogenase formation chaperone [methanotrophic endosymbiont of Bathymodiolus puteoserpentis (Logatchev)]|jgi:hydrogenase expression/formation protein HypC|uniref:HypC/HybG/HupF family hydrogenase formation chaperone n=1 Tax=methanotrophic endosymbiont of Bathymodiolus puteoserpentis (Logatchev) TaxID=343235 RepID=UPI0013C7CA35|nr:HypC/HybG/HupF family hydrogenase formation chaperone [methanotrophic endosymbiont of Bathymodiolus puteoserpentis (Logatchev)]SHE22348.1 [NiFe] hydrogenase metallocenter assembly protein HypC [methanotrophic endosymbiont of Bathymodiolus puteoserpentis (Logatchev)]